MSARDPFQVEDSLPDPLPPDPMPLFKAWFDAAAAHKAQPNPDAMALATVDFDGRPSLRIVLCRGLDVTAGRITFFTNRQSRKGRALTANPHAAADFFWDHLGRQAIIEGPVTPSPDDESDAYFRGRPLERQIAAWASDQSRPLDSRDALLAKVVEVSERFGVRLTPNEPPNVPRPPHWGGYRLHARRVELWVNSQARAHDRAEWTRDLAPDGAGFRAGPWRSTRLQP